MDKNLLFKDIEQELSLDIELLLEEDSLKNIYEYKKLQNFIDYEHFENEIIKKILTNNFNKIENFFINNKENIELLDEEANKIFSQWLQIEKLYKNAEDRLKEVLTKDEFNIFKERLNDISTVNNHFQEKIINEKIKNINAKTLLNYQKLFFDNEEIMDLIFYKKENLTEQDINFYNFFKHVYEFFGQGLTSEIAGAYFTYIQSGQFDKDYQENKNNIRDLINSKNIEEGKDTLETLACSHMEKTLNYKSAHTHENSASIMYFSNIYKRRLDQRAGPGQMDVVMASSDIENHFHITEVTGNRSIDDIYKHAKIMVEKITTLSAMGEALGFTFTLNIGFRSFKKEEIQNLINNQEKLESSDYVEKIKNLLTFAIPEAYIDASHFNQKNIEINLFAFGDKIKKFERDHSYKNIILFLEEVKYNNINKKIIPQFLENLFDGVTRLIDIETREDIANEYYPKIYNLLKDIELKFNSNNISKEIRSLKYRTNPNKIQENLNESTIQKSISNIGYEKLKEKQKEFGVFSGDSYFIESVTNLGYPSHLANEVINISDYIHNDILNKGIIDYDNLENNTLFLQSAAYVDKNRRAQGTKPISNRTLRSFLLIETANVKGNYTRPPAFLKGVSQPTSAIKVNQKRILESIVSDLIEIGKTSRKSFQYFDKYGSGYGFKPLLERTIEKCEKLQKEKLYNHGYGSVETGHNLYEQIEDIKNKLKVSYNKIESIVNNSYDIEEEVNKKVQNKEYKAHECIKNFDEINSNQEDRNTLLNNINNILSKDEKTKIRQKI